MSSEDEPLPAPTEALAAFEPFVRWLLAASVDDLTSVPENVFSGFEAATMEDDDEPNTTNFDSTPKESRPLFENACKARLALAEAEGELETAWDHLSCAQREWGTLDEKLLTLRDERDENREHIALLERRIIKLLQDRDLAIAETYTTEKQIQDAEYFKAKQQHRRQQQEEEQRKQRVASVLRKLLLRESGNSSGSQSPTASSSLKYSEKDVQRLHKELADSKVAAAVAKAERDERRHAMRRAERRCVELKLALAQARAEEDDLQVSLQQLTRARRSSVDHLQQISLFSAAALPLQPPPAPTAGLRASTG